MVPSGPPQTKADYFNKLIAESEFDPIIYGVSLPYLNLYWFIISLVGKLGSNSEWQSKGTFRHRIWQDNRFYRYCATRQEKAGVQLHC